MGDEVRRASGIGRNGTDGSRGVARAELTLVDEQELPLPRTQLDAPDPEWHGSLALPSQFGECDFGGLLSAA